MSHFPVLVLEGCPTFTLGIDQAIPTLEQKFALCICIHSRKENKKERSFVGLSVKS
jgi:hypothetical protein